MNLDILIYGLFNKNLINKKYKFHCSTNQRIIDVQKSLEIGKIVL